mgnify:CR=1 FL=1
MSQNLPQKKIIIIGGGPAGMTAAIELSKHHNVHLYEKGKTLGRKFLVAGKGGFNLSNNVIGTDLLSKYSPEEFLNNILLNFDTKATKTWLYDLGIPTYVGSSGRIFPEKGIKPIEVLNAFKNKIISQGGKIHYEHEFKSFDSKKINFLKEGKIIHVEYDYCVFALGGGSWSVTGSKGDWLQSFEENNIKTLPFEASNCGLEVDFNNKEINNFIGTPLKNIQINCNGKTIKGEAVISKYGLEGNAIYPISSIAREALHTNSNAFLEIDLKPFNTEEELLTKITETTLPKNYRYIFNLNKSQIALIKSFTNKETYLNPLAFSKTLKRIKIPILKLRPVEEAISTVGGISLDELNNDLSLKKMPHIYITGEMFDWDTITGGYLLQGCFSTAMYASKHIHLKIEN